MKRHSDAIARFYLAEIYTPVAQGTAVIMMAAEMEYIRGLLQTWHVNMSNAMQPTVHPYGVKPIESVCSL